MKNWSEISISLDAGFIYDSDIAGDGTNRGLYFKTDGGKTLMQK